MDLHVVQACRVFQGGRTGVEKVTPVLRTLQRTVFACDLPPSLLHFTGGDLSANISKFPCTRHFASGLPVSESVFPLILVILNCLSCPPVLGKDTPLPFLP